MKRLAKVLPKPRFTTAASTAHINFDEANRSIMVGRSGDSGGYIGRVCEMTSKGRNIFDSSVWFNAGFPNVIGVFGMRGTGKSFNLGVFAECLAGTSQVNAGKSLSPAIVILDVQNQFWTLSMPPTSNEDKKHVEMLEKWKLAPEAVPNIHCWMPPDIASHIPDTREYRIAPEQLDESDWLALLEQERYSPIGQALLELLHRSDDRDPANLVKNARTGGMLSSYQSSTVDSLRWRLESVAKSNLIGNPGIDVGEFLMPGRVSVVLLRDLSESLRTLTVATLVRLLSARMTEFHQQQRIAKRGKTTASNKNLPQQLWVMMDEAHVIAPNDGRTAANAPLIDYVKRGRDSGLSLIFATQQPSAVDDKLMSQVDMTLTHALGFEADVQAAVARMPTRRLAEYTCGGETLKTPSDIIRSLKTGEAVLADSGNQRPIIVQLRPRLSVHGGDTPNSSEQQ